ncbi:MAG: ferritin family protein [Pseudomonadota bacterium]
MSTPTLQILERAIQAEIEGYHFYQMAAAATADSQGKATFEAMAEDELRHAEFLRAQHAAISSHGHADALIRIAGEPGFDGHTPFFSTALKARAATAHVEMTALSVAAQLEADAMRFYREQSTAAEEPTVRAFFAELADWERGHHDALVAQMRSLEQEYWAVNRFAPF